MVVQKVVAVKQVIFTIHKKFYVSVTTFPLFTICEQCLILSCALQDCFLLDTGSGVYVWIGSGSTKQEKVKSMEMAG